MCGCELVCTRSLHSPTNNVGWFAVIIMNTIWLVRLLQSLKFFLFLPAPLLSAQELVSLHHVRLLCSRYLKEKKAKIMRLLRKFASRAKQWESMTVCLLMPLFVPIIRSVLWLPSCGKHAAVLKRTATYAWSLLKYRGVPKFWTHRKIFMFFVTLACARSAPGLLAHAQHTKP